MRNNKVALLIIVGVLVLGSVTFFTWTNFNKKSDGVKQIFSDTSLDLSNKNLDKIPSYVLSLSNLEKLDISNNKLNGALPSEIGNLKKLKVLNASNNLMTGVPAEIGKLTELEIIDLSNNKLTGLPYELGNLKKLKILNLSGNDYSKQDLNIIKKSLPSDVQIIL